MFSLTAVITGNATVSYLEIIERSDFCHCSVQAWAHLNILLRVAFSSKPIAEVSPLTHLCLNTVQNRQSDKQIVKQMKGFSDKLLTGLWLLESICVYSHLCCLYERTVSSGFMVGYELRTVHPSRLECFESSDRVGLLQHICVNLITSAQLG